jgi:glucan endo-1,3-alpha-glucosidase
MAPICLQFWGANANRYFEYSGAAGMRAMWMNAINISHPDWVELITWNDFIEGTYISPIDDPNKYPGANYLNGTGVPLDTPGYFHSHAGATELLPYFIQWYKTGSQPTIARDQLFFFYRTQRKDIDAGVPSVANKYGPVEDVIYITANLTAPAELHVTSGRSTTVLHLTVGSTDTKAPFAEGAAPSFELFRNGKLIASGRGEDEISASPKYNNFYYSTGTLTAPP